MSKDNTIYEWGDETELNTTRKNIDEYISATELLMKISKYMTKN